VSTRVRSRYARPGPEPSASGQPSLAFGALSRRSIPEHYIRGLRGAAYLDRDGVPWEPFDGEPAFTAATIYGVADALVE